MTQIGADISRARRLLQAGKLVAIPTETVYGLAGNAINTGAVTEIFRVKDRPFFDPLIVHTDRLEKIRDYILEIPGPLEELASRFMPGPLTILVHKTAMMPDLVTAGSSKVAIRIPDHPITFELLRQLDFPLAAPSANPFGYVSPTSAQHVYDQLKDKIPYILDGGPCSVGLESTIIDYDQGQIQVLRKGGITVEEIEKITGPVKMMERSTSRPSAPGMLDQHYAPGITLTLQPLQQILSQYSPEKIGLLAFEKGNPQIKQENQFVLSTHGDLAMAAQNFFRHLRELDKMDLDIIVAELVPEKGMGRAINDKLKRAAIKSKNKLT